MVHLLKWFKTPCILDSKDWACSTFYINFYSISKNKKEKHFKSTLLSFALCLASSGVAAGTKFGFPGAAANAPRWGRQGGTRGGEDKWGWGAQWFGFFSKAADAAVRPPGTLVGGGSQVTFHLGLLGCGGTQSQQLPMHWLLLGLSRSCTARGAPPWPGLPENYL